MNQIAFRLLLVSTWCVGALLASAPIVFVPSSAIAAKKRGKKKPKVDCTDPCAQEGKCRVKRGKCVATKKSDCSKSTGCTAEGRCTLKKGECVVGSKADCEGSSGCSESGLCHNVVDRCEAVIAADCHKSTGCLEKGKCTLIGASCALTSTDDCKRSKGCTEKGKCTFLQGRCINGKNLDKDKPAPSSGPSLPGGPVAGISLVTTSILGSPDPTLYMGIALRGGWAISPKLVALAGIEYTLDSTWTTNRTTNATSTNAAEPTRQIAQSARSVIRRFGAWAHYYLVGEYKEKLAISAIGGLAAMQYNIGFDDITQEPGYETLGIDAMNMTYFQIDVGGAAEYKLGPVHGLLDVRASIPLAGGLNTTLDLESPIALTIQLGARIGL